MKQQKKSINTRVPEMFRPLLWWVKWENVDADKDKEDIVVSAVNEGTLDHWRWLIQTYGKETVRKILESRLASEFHSESRNLAKVIFSVSHFRHARRSAF